MWWPGRYLIENIVFPAIIMGLFLAGSAFFYHRELGRREAAHAASMQAVPASKAVGVTLTKP